MTNYIFNIATSFLTRFTQMTLAHSIQTMVARHLPAACLLVLTFSLHAANADSTKPLDAKLLDLKLEDLLNIQITSASKKQESLNTVASAVYVISNEDIHRSGVTTVPEALRMVPGIQVARIDSNKWAITARGFNGRFANKLLVLVDGRTVYSPSFSGVYWEMQDMRLEDIERVEVIRGPGGSVWGANAVNGVINIITKHAADTLGSEAVVGAGNYEKTILNGRAGAKLGENTYARLSVNANRRGSFKKSNGADSNDEWETYRLSTRLDQQFDSSNNFSIIADYNNGEADQDTIYPIYTAPYQATNSSEVDFSNWNILSRWDHTISNTNDFTLQLYYDQFDREEFAYKESRDSYDIDFTHRFQLSAQQHFIWGLGYRNMSDNIKGGAFIEVFPESRENELFNFFVQDQISITDKVSLTLGLKWEKNDYTDEEIQPSAKLSWQLTHSTQVWASASKAVRTPSVQEIDTTVLVRSAPCASFPDASTCPSPDIAVANASVPAKNLSSEELIAYELGLRNAISATANIDLALFYNDYQELRSYFIEAPEVRLNPEPHIFVPASLNNNSSGKNYGLELATNWAASDKLLFNLSYTYTKTDMNWENYIDINQNTPAPSNQASLQANYKLSSTLETNLWLRYVDDTTVISGFTEETIDAYTAVDFNITWKLTPSIELQLVGQNLFDNSHPEYIQEIIIAPTEVQRSIFGKATFKF